MLFKISYYKNHQIKYQVKGEGKTIFLIPGFTENLHVYDAIEAQLSLFFKVITFDMPGTYSSEELFKAETEWSMDHFSQLILSVADQENAEKFFVFGHSMGGYVALTLASSRPERLYGMGLIHSTAYADSQERIDLRLKSIDFILKNGTEKFIEQVVNGLYSEAYREKYAQKVKEHITAAQTIKKEVLISQYKAMMFRQDHCKTLQMFNKPVLFVAGDEDNSVPLKDSLAQCTLPRISQISILRATGHNGFVEQPELTAEILRKYCQFVFSI